MASQLDLYIEQGSKSDVSGDVEMNLYAELTQGIYATGDEEQKLQEQQSAISDLEDTFNTIPHQQKSRVAQFDRGSSDDLHPRSATAFLSSHVATNYLLALIAFLLFILLIIHD